jgi:hypothetical protein
MKNLLVFLSLALTLVFTQTAVSAADGAFQSEQEINGSWLLEYTKISNQTKVRGDTWVFKNGTMIMKDIPQVRGDKYDSSPVTFKIEDGQLKISVLGRPGRFDIYSLVSKTADTMDLKSNLGEIFHFIKK